ncbi:hypothetical protein ScPMuIL_002502 [Solemya velum]
MVRETGYYDILGKRETYDRGGEEAIKGGGTGGMDFHAPMDIFDMFFGGGRGGRRNRGSKKGKDVVHQLSVSLEKLYNGATRKLALHKKVLCGKCEGRGGEEEAVERCSTCKGSGMQVKVHQLAPGFIQQVQTVCGDCQGQGERINPKYQERKILEVHIDKGMKDGENIRFHGEGDQEPGIEPGDVLITLDEKEHSVFRRHDRDLIMPMQIELVEALCGFHRTITTLDRRTLVISTIPGEVIKHGDIKCIMNEGMPLYRDPFEKGRLIIKFTVNFPENNFSSTAKISLLEKYLPPRPELVIPDCAEELDLVDYSLSNNASGRRRGEAYDEDDGEPGVGGQRVECASQ